MSSEDMPHPLLDVFWAGKPAGTLRRTEEGTWFEYRRDFGDTHLHGGGIAFNLPRDRGPFFAPGNALHPFFAGLLPPETPDPFGALAKFGRDLAGCVAVIVPDSEAPDPAPPMPPLAESDLSDQFALRRGLSIGLPGHHDKIHYPDEGVFIKLGSAGRPHDLENEQTMLHLAHLCGIRVADTHLVRDRSARTGLWVARFDRKGHQRLHQENARQILNAATNPGLWHVAVALQSVASHPGEAMRKLLQRAVFAYLTGNSEFHAGKIGIFEAAPGKWDLTPAYGLRTTLPYSKLRRNMALGIGGQDDGFTMKDFVALFESHLLSPTEIREQIQQVSETLGENLHELDRIGFEPKMTHGIRRVIEHRRARLVG